MLALAITPSTSKLTKTKSTVHRRSKMENRNFGLSEILQQRKLLGKFAGSMVIDTPQKKHKKVRNLESKIGLPPGRKLAAVRRKETTLKKKDSGVERKLRGKGRWFGCVLIGRTCDYSEDWSEEESAFFEGAALYAQASRSPT